MAVLGVTVEAAERRALADGAESVSRNGGSGGTAHQGKSDERVTLQELAISNANEIAALVAVLERKGLLRQQEILEEIQRQRKQKAR